jgi:hypothetical protein
MLGSLIAGCSGDEPRSEPMAHAQPVQRAFPGTTRSLTHLAAAFVAALAIMAAVTIGGIRLFGPAADPPGTLSPAVLRSAQMWELERHAQLGYVDPVMESGREWERQRRQQSSDY